MVWAVTAAGNMVGWDLVEITLQNAAGYAAMGHSATAGWAQPLVRAALLAQVPGLVWGTVEGAPVPGCIRRR